MAGRRRVQVSQPPRTLLRHQLGLRYYEPSNIHSNSRALPSGEGAKRRGLGIGVCGVLVAFYVLLWELGICAVLVDCFSLMLIEKQTSLEQAILNVLFLSCPGPAILVFGRLQRVRPQVRLVGQEAESGHEQAQEGIHVQPVVNLGRVATSDDAVQKIVTAADVRSQGFVCLIFLLGKNKHNQQQEQHT